MSVVLENSCFYCKINENSELKAFKYSEKLFQVFKIKRKFKSTEITDPFLRSLKAKVEHLLLEIKKITKFPELHPDFIENQRSENIEFINNFHKISAQINFPEFFAENNLNYSVLHKFQNQSFIIPPNCRFFNKDIRNLSDYLNSDSKFDLVVLDPCWKNRYIKRAKKLQNKNSYPVLENEEIQKIPLENYIHKNSIVIIWCTNSETHINALKSSIIPKWNLKLLQTWYWIKIDKTGELLTPFNNPHMKQPFEQLFICTHQDNLEIAEEIEKEKVFFSVPSSIHSHKPHLLDLFSEFLPETPKCLELFARSLREGFTSVGIEVLQLQNLELYQETESSKIFGKMAELVASPQENLGKYCFSIDRGGTFTDVLCICPGNKVRTMKLLSVDPDNYKDSPTEGIRRILQEETGNALTAQGLIDTSLIGFIRMGTTVATNALLERKGEKAVLVVNSGFKDLLFIGNQARPKIFELNIKKPSNLYEEVVEINCRIVPAQEGICQLDTSNWRSVEGIAGKQFLVQNELNEEEVRTKLKSVLEKGIKSVAVSLAHNYACPEHELKIGKIAKDLGFEYVTLSHQSMPMQRLVNRGFTTMAESYLTPHVERYLESFRKGFHNNLKDVEVLFMQSDGGLTAMDRFRAARAILSGPASGVVGYAITGSRYTDLPLIGFDMGGTSTDVSRFDGKYEHVVESTTAGVTIQCAQLDINTVAAGGGSRLFFRSGLFVVGPESASSHPGPACYKKNGPLTVTDANLVLGRLFPEYFPKIFGPKENEPLDFSASLHKFEELTQQINQYFLENDVKKEKMNVQEVAMGFIRVANESMCRPIRALTQSRGFDTSKHALCVFGGAGGQHACSIAKDLGMKTVLIHKYAGILSAYGLALADVVVEDQEPSGLELVGENLKSIKNRMEALSENCKQKLNQQGFQEVVLETYLHLRYHGTDCALMVSPEQEVSEKSFAIENFGDYYTSFLKRYQKEFGFTLNQRKIIVDDIRVRGSGKTSTPEERDIEKSTTKSPAFEKIAKVYFEKEFLDTKIYLSEKLKAGDWIEGPAVVIDKLSTILIEPRCTGEVTDKGDIIIKVSGSSERIVDDKLDSIQLSIFSHRFMSIAEQMGRVLQRTSISTNIKERLDFSCALFGADGGLVSNAPHIPVHLGAMQETVQFQLRTRGDTLKAGDVLLSNHPQAGGSHLPDLTVITPVFYPNVSKPVFFVASRGHHADIGGITPGSMPPHSKSLEEEGAAFKSFLLVDGGVFNEKGIIERLTTATNAPGAKGTRNLSDNLSDLKAQIAANQKGIQLVVELIDAYGLKYVQAYMNYIQDSAESFVRDMLKEIAKETYLRTKTTSLFAEEKMDDGTSICLNVTIDGEKGNAVFDFTGTGYEVYGNCNAPRAITLSAIIYCLRCMVGYDIPLNQGCLTPIKVIIPDKSILNPSDNAAVVGGNVLTSQRIVDTILKAFSVCAASQGCMNNITVGDETWGYYETVGGGSGACSISDGVGGVHTHMTNTRITDPEILEARYPIILQKFMLRNDESGGKGRFSGGEGVQRELLFRRPLTLSVLTERRTLAPYGLNGGSPAKCGLNLLKKKDGRIINLGGKTAVSVEAGDIFSMLTPGGGGYGSPESKDTSKGAGNSTKPNEFIEKGSVFAYRMQQESV